MIRIAYIPREDASRVQGGDYLSIMSMSRLLPSSGIEVTAIPFNQLHIDDLPDAVFISQLNNIDLAERVLQWTQNNHLPLLLSPLFEDELSLSFGAALDGTGKWKCTSQLLGTTIAEVIFTRWHTLRRTRHTSWHRRRHILQNAHLLPNTFLELRHLTAWFQLRSPHAHVVPLGVDSAIYSSAEQLVTALPETLREHAGRYVLQVGLISQRKNQLGLMFALMDTTYPLVFLGRESPYEPDYAKRLRVAAKRRGNVTFIEHVDEPTLLAIYQHAAVHVMPSWSERPGMVTLEAAASGCHVVATDRSTISEYLGQRAHYCNPAKSDTIYSAIYQALGTSVIGDTSSYIISHFSWEHTARCFNSAVREILS